MLARPICLHPVARVCVETAEATTPCLTFVSLTLSPPVFLLTDSINTAMFFGSLRDLRTL